VRWAEFEAAAPELAATSRALLERSGLVLLATIRRDGTPRISPVEVHIVRGELMLVLIARTHKVVDVLRDPRVVLQTPVTDPAEPGDELKLRGRVVEVGDATQRSATADAIAAASGWRPAATWRFFALRLLAVAHIAWRRGDMLLTRWDRDRGVRPTERRRLDHDASGYVRDGGDPGTGGA
jgi:Pyridoxamine 5'-phosphate oxidase